MKRSAFVAAALLASLGIVAGCSWFPHERRAAWRLRDEESCLGRGLVKFSTYIRPARAIDGPGMCGLEHPLRVTAFSDGQVPLTKPETMDCPMASALQTWIDGIVQPAALARFGQRVTGIHEFGAYSCRPVNNTPGNPYSEHAFGNAIDIAGFKLADGTEVNVLRDWGGPDPQRSAFLREVHGAACGRFRTVLGPGFNALHANHFHFDLGMHGRTTTGYVTFCRPTPPKSLLPPPAPADGLPPAPPLPMEVDAKLAPRISPDAGPRHAFTDAPLPLMGISGDGAAADYRALSLPN
ncbi:MAG: extensin family protein [Hyphomicrobiales bacterium]|nr:extensin family protein [Hyphomicrobiales bacterium]